MIKINLTAKEKEMLNKWDNMSDREFEELLAECGVEKKLKKEFVEQETMYTRKPCYTNIVANVSNQCFCNILNEEKKNFLIAAMTKKKQFFL